MKNKNAKEGLKVAMLMTFSIIMLGFILFLIVQMFVITRDHIRIDRERDAFFEKYNIEIVD